MSVAPYVLPPAGPPTPAGFAWFVTNVMQVPSAALNPADPAVAWSFNVAYDLALTDIALVSSYQYVMAVYNLAGDRLINWASDVGSSTYWQDLRTKFNCYKFAGGVVANAGDESTSASLQVIDALKMLTVGDLQNLKTPYGQAYIAVAQQVGTVWGLS